MESTWVTAEQMGELVSVSAQTIKRWAREGVIPCIKINDRNVRFDPAKVREALEQRSEATQNT